MYNSLRPILKYRGAAKILQNNNIIIYSTPALEHHRFHNVAHHSGKRRPVSEGGRGPGSMSVNTLILNTLCFALIKIMCSHFSYLTRFFKTLCFYWLSVWQGSWCTAGLSRAWIYDETMSCSPVDKENKEKAVHELYSSGKIKFFFFLSLRPNAGPRWCQKISSLV